MVHPILGLHHVTATVDDAQADLDFCLKRLGLRLVKKTVNFDNTGVYHFYFGTDRGSPGTIWTTFPYGGLGVPVGRKGRGQVVATAFSVPRASIDGWREDMSRVGLPPIEDLRFGDPVLRVPDPSGLAMELVGNEEDERPSWHGSRVGPTQAIRGLHSVSMMVANAKPTVELMTGTLGYRVVGEEGDRIRLAAGHEGPGHFIDVVSDPDAEPARNGVGTVHHVAMAISTAEEQLRLREELVGMRVGVTPVMDRCYFQSIYFREPGGVLFEVATIEPGFLVDEELGSLGRELKLPPWEEPNRAGISSKLPVVSYP